MKRPLGSILLAAALAVAGFGGARLASSQAPPAAPPAPATSPAPAPPATAPGDVPPKEIQVVLTGPARPQIKLAFPSIPGLSALTGTLGNAARELEQTLRHDLDRSGIFEMQGPDDFTVLALTGDLAKDAEQYRSLGNEVVLLNEIKVEGDKIVLEGRLSDLASQQTIVGKRYRGTPELARRIAHTFADEIVLFLTSRRGIALTSLAFYSDRDKDKEIYLMDYDGFDQRRITGHRSISMSPAWSPSGDAVAYVSFFAGGGPAVYLADITSGRKSPVVTDGSLNSSPSFSPDGQHIVFARSAGSNIEIFVCDRDGKNLRRLTNSPGIDTNPAWSPSGQEIAFTSSRAGGPQIYVMDDEGTNVRRVTFQGDYNDGASWNPDGTSIAYATRTEPNRFDLAMVDLVSLGVKLLTSSGGSNESPSFAPDGRKLAFTSTRAGGTQVFVMNADGSGIEQLTFQGNNWAPDWSGYLK